MNEIEYSPKYQPLFELLNGKYPLVDTVIMTGGRASGKSHVVATHSVIGLVNYNWSTLYTRYTSLSIVDSVKPEVSDKVEMLGYQKYVTDTQSHIDRGNNRIAFKGIKTGSKMQTANLKSLSGFNCFVVDEAEELPDLKTFKKVFYSIRSTNKRNLTILILNPTTKDHWIFQEFFEKKGLDGGENCIIDNVMYIHTSYKDVNQKFIPDNIIRDYERMKIDNLNEYENIVSGGWITEPEGVLLPKSKLHFADLSQIPTENIIFKFAIGDPADVGGDKFSMPFIHVISHENRLVCFVKEVIHSTAGIDANTERVLQKMHENEIEQLIYESNGVGLAAVLLIKKRLSEHQKLTAYASTINKETRIFSHYEFVRDYFVFDINYQENAEYKQFINDMCGYSKEGDNKHKKDAIDVMCAAANLIKVKYKKVLYG